MDIKLEISKLDKEIDQIAKDIDVLYKTKIRPLEDNQKELYKKRKQLSEMCNHVLSRDKSKMYTGDGCTYSKCIICNTHIMILQNSVFE